MKNLIKILKLYSISDILQALKKKKKMRQNMFLTAAKK